jgi:hypothetical protein
MFRFISMAALAGMVSGCASTDQGKLYSQTVKPRTTHLASVTSDSARSPKVAEPRSAKISEPQIVLGAAY